jgi:hypothetical protein
MYSAFYLSASRKKKNRKTNNIELEEKEVYDVLVYTLKREIRSNINTVKRYVNFTYTSKDSQTHQTLFPKHNIDKNKCFDVSQQTHAHEHEHNECLQKRQQQV